MAVQDIEVATASPSPATQHKGFITAAVLVMVLSVCGAMLGMFIKGYIDRKVDEAVANRVDARAELAAESVIKGKPDLVADALNRFIKTQQDDAARQEDQTHRANWAQMARFDDGTPVLGDAGAKVSVVYFFDAACPYCKQMDGLLRSLTDADTGVKVIYREIPILGDASKRAARFAAALWKLSPADYDSFHGALLGYRGQLNDGVVDRIAIESLGPDLALKVAAAATADKEGALESHIQAQLELAKKIGLHGTPFFGVGGLTFFDGATSREKFMAAVKKAKHGEGG